MPELLTLEVASKIISERKNVACIFRGEYAVGWGRDFLDTYNNPCKTGELLVKGK